MSNKSEQHDTVTELHIRDRNVLGARDQLLASDGRDPFSVIEYMLLEREAGCVVQHAPHPTRRSLSVQQGQQL